MPPAPPDAPNVPTLPVDHLDGLRGMAALAVFAWHWRNLLFAEFEQVAEAGAWQRAFYFLTGFGHEAVMVFFVLSGFLITRSVLNGRARGAHSWRRYAIARLVRLELVLLPALMLGAAWDAIGLWRFGAEGPYAGHWPDGGASVIHYAVAERLGGWQLLGNAVFLQEIRVAPLGSNGPLWSLSYEGWYYVAFPLLLVAVWGPGSWALRLACAAGLAALGAWVGPQISWYFAIWGVGALVAALPQSARLRGRAGRWCLAGAGALALGTMALSRVHLLAAGWGGDALVGAAFALMLYVLVSACGPTGRPAYARATATLASFSYTLYLVHTPVLLLAAVALHGGWRWQPDGPHLGLALGVGLAVLAYAWGLSRLTEARTEAVRAWLEARWRAPFPREKPTVDAG